MTDLEKPYGIPLGCLISKDIKNLLLSGRCISMDAKVLATARIMPTCMAVGQAAGVCAGFAVSQKILPSQVQVNTVMEQLKSDGSILTA